MPPHTPPIDMIVTRWSQAIHLQVQVVTNLHPSQCLSPSGVRNSVQNSNSQDQITLNAQRLNSSAILQRQPIMPTFP